MSQDSISGSRKENAVFDRYVEYIDIQELENHDPHLFIAAAAELSHLDGASLRFPIPLLQLSWLHPGVSVSQDVRARRRALSQRSGVFPSCRSSSHLRRINSRQSLNRGAGGSATFSSSPPDAEGQPVSKARRSGASGTCPSFVDVCPAGRGRSLFASQQL